MKTVESLNKSDAGIAEDIRKVGKGTVERTIKSMQDNSEFS
jgi:hypothetical protein